MQAQSESPSSAAANAERVSKYWAKQFDASRADPSVWINNHLVTAHIYRLISGGSEAHWLSWFFEEYLRGQTVFEKSLSICCGDGAHELTLYRSGKVRFVHGVDLSEEAIANATAAFEKEGVPKECYRFEVADANDLEVEGSFDLILASSALHHVANLEGLLSRLRALLSPDGYLVVQEYVGPNRFQWTDQQLRLINGILRQLDPRYLKDHKRIELSRPPMDQFLAIDPSEAIRSEDILRLMREYFTLEYHRNYNGTITHQLYPLLNSEFTNAGSPEFDSILRLILFFEDVLISEKVIPSDFIFSICRRKEAKPSRPPSAPVEDGEHRYVGYIDSFDSNGIAGWAVNAAQPQSPVILDLYIDDRWETRLECNQFRPDLRDAGYGDGAKGFHFRFDPQRGLTEKSVARLVVAGGDQMVAVRFKS